MSVVESVVLLELLSAYCQYFEMNSFGSIAYLDRRCQRLSMKSADFQGANCKKITITNTLHMVFLVPVMRSNRIRDVARVFKFWQSAGTPKNFLGDEKKSIKQW